MGGEGGLRITYRNVEGIAASQTEISVRLAGLDAIKMQSSRPLFSYKEKGRSTPRHVMYIFWSEERELGTRARFRAVGRKRPVSLVTGKLVIFPVRFVSTHVR